MKIIETDKAPKAIGPYSQAIFCAGFIFCSGQIGINPDNQEMVSGGVENEFRQVLKNINGILESQSISKENVLKTTLFLADMNDFSLVNKIYEDFFGSHKPARSTICVKSLPKNALVELEVIAKG